MRLLKKKFVQAMAVCMVVASVIPSTAMAATVPEGELYTLTIMHTNDIHGHVENLPEYATVVNQVRAEAKNVILVDGGDIFLRGEFAEFQGETEMEILNAMGYDAWVPGNNDFRIGPNGGTIVQGNKQLQDRIGQSNFATLCANVTMKDGGGFIDNVAPYTIKDVNGVKVGIIGVTSLKPQLRSWVENSDKVFESGDTTVSNMIAEVDAKSDIEVVLSHAGIAVDLNIAKISGVDAVLGADDHYLLNEPIYMTNKGQKTTPITQNGGEENHFLGRLDLVFKNQDGQMILVDFTGQVYDLDLVKEDPTVRGIIEKYRVMQNKKATA